MNQQQGMNIADQMRTGMNLLGWISQTGGVSVEVFLHRRFGSRYLGIPAALALLLIPLFGLFFERHDLRPLVSFWWLYVIMLILAKCGVLIRPLGAVEHSRYSGRPRFFRSGTPARELRAKLVYEPLLVALLGMVLIGNGSIPLGYYLLFAACCLTVKTRMQQAIQAHMEMDMQDALIDQQLRIERLREMNKR